jgi:hypothetical protein
MRRIRRSRSRRPSYEDVLRSEQSTGAEAVAGVERDGRDVSARNRRGVRIVARGHHTARIQARVRDGALVKV